MKISFLVLIFAVLVSCSKTEKETGSPQAAQQEAEKPASESQGEVEKKEASWLEPGLLTADFNGDGRADTAFTLTVLGKKGIRIVHGGKGEAFVLGAGNAFGHGGDDFSWADSWRLVHDSVTYHQTFAENGDVLEAEEVPLKATALYIEKEEVGGATIAWINGRYVWLHQAD